MAGVEKCPACGSLRESFAAVCPDCGYEFTDIQTSESLQKFSDKIDEYDRLIADNYQKKGSKIGFWSIIAWIVLFPIMFGIFVFKKLKAKHEELEGHEKLKSQAILNFPIPNSRNDLMEFSMLVESRVRPISYFNALGQSGMNTQKWNKIWLEKASHIEKKAQMALKDDHSTLSQIRTSNQNAAQLYRKNDQMQWIMMGGLFALFIIVLIFALN